MKWRNSRRKGPKAKAKRDHNKMKEDKIKVIRGVEASFCHAPHWGSCFIRSISTIKTKAHLYRRVFSQNSSSFEIMGNMSQDIYGGFLSQLVKFFKNKNKNRKARFHIYGEKYRENLKHIRIVRKNMEIMGEGKSFPIKKSTA